MTNGMPVVRVKGKYLDETFMKKQAELVKAVEQISENAGKTIGVLVYAPPGKMKETVGSLLKGEVPKCTSRPNPWEVDLNSLNRDQIRAYLNSLQQHIGKVNARLEQLKRQQLSDSREDLSSSNAKKC